MRYFSGISAFILLLLISFAANVQAQYTTVSGNVYDISARRPLEAVAVQSTSGRGTITDSTGYYNLTVLKTDSIWFSLIGKSTMKYPVDTISNLERFNVMIHVRAFDLPEVKVRNNYYRYDSMMNRQDYAKVFNFKKPSLGVVSSPNYNPGASVGFDLEGIINMFRVKRNRSILTLQKRLIEEEEEKYVNSRFTKIFVKKITGLQSPELDTFMRRYRPAYGLVKLLNDLELGYYIGKQYEDYRSSKYNWRGGLYRRRDD
ncbi:hypothetical protein [Sediminibacterium sp. C3]|uniref:hypothetical protein n=1 Tax=Sediminibacterium sp. C3 TaxID=1267211 RepID=UPI000413C15F|nr:hypothetical protein [Sediminibacterium sp. C3]